MERFMKINLRTIALAALFATSVVAGSAGSASARDNDRRWEESHRVADRRDLHQEHQGLEYWRNKLQYDESHHASRKKLAEDNNSISQIESDMRVDRRR
jgi:hypothetical protein